MESFQGVRREVAHQRNREVSAHHEETKGGKELATGRVHNGIVRMMALSKT
jgi:hypothetical protein